MALSFNVLVDDPTTQLCMVSNTFRKVNTKEYRPDILTIPLVEISEPIPEMISIKSCPSSLIKGFNELQVLKDKLGKIKGDLIKKNNPYENIGNSIFMSRAAIKLANIDAIFHLTTNWGRDLIPQKPDHTMYFCDLAGGPGAFSQYLLWRVVNSTSYGITLKTENQRLLWDKGLTNDPRFKSVSGVDGTGNLYNMDNIRDFYQKVIEDDKTGGVHLVVADGGFETEGSECANREFLTSRLISAECFLGVSVLRKGGHLVCKLYDTVTQYMKEMLYLMALVFEEICIFKPISSRPINAERYLVCKGLRGNVEEIREYMIDLLNAYTNDKYIESFLVDDIPTEFTNWWKRQNVLSIDRQRYYTERLLNQLEGKKVEPIRFNAHKALILWDLPGNVDRIDTPHHKRISTESNIESIDYENRSPYKYDNVEQFLNSEHRKEYPYKAIYYEKNDIVDMFKRLRNYKYDPLHYVNSKDRFQIANLDLIENELIYRGSEKVGSQRVIITKKEDYLQLEILSDIFNEHARLQATVIGSSDNPYNCYFKNISNIAAQAIAEEKFITPHTLREAAYNTCKEVTSFKPNILTRLINMFKPKSMLDFSAGWGDRLVAAMAADISYTGVDPNPAVHKGYQEMINFFSQVPELHVDESKYKLIQSPFEDVKEENLPNVDLVMTSPPYFDLESYTSHKDQSIVKYGTEDAWIDRFLLPSLTKCVNKLNESGYLAININQRDRAQKYVRRMLTFMKTKANMEYLGVLFYAKVASRVKGNDGKTVVKFSNPQPIWIWRKGTPKIHLLPIIPQMKYEISNIVKDIDVMRYVGQGTAWNEDKLIKFVKYQTVPDCNHYQRAVLIDGKVEGIVMIHKVGYESKKESNDFFVTIFFNRNVISNSPKEKKGFGSRSLKMAIEDFTNSHQNVESIYADVRFDNIRAQRLFKGFKYEKDVVITVQGNPLKYKRYRLDLSKDKGISFLTAFEYLSDEVYRRELSKIGWKCISKEEAVSRCYVDLLVLGDKYEWDSKFFEGVSAKLKQHLIVDILTNKVNLHNALKGKEYIADTLEVLDDTEIPDDGYWIWKLEGEYAGYGIHIFNTQEELERLKREREGKRAIISRYITDPILLEDGRKFHLRIFLVIMTDGKEVKALVFNMGRLGAAKKKFVLNNWDDPSIHITHMTNDYFIYPDNFPQPDLVEDINSQIDNILKDVVYELSDYISKYEESEAGYKLLGCDFIVRENGKVILLEINYKPGFKMLNKQTNELVSSVLAQGTIDDIILPYFKVKDAKYEHTRLVGHIIFE